MKKPISKTTKSTDPRKKLSPEVRDALDTYNEEMRNHILSLTQKSDREMKRYVTEQNKKSNQEMKKHVTETLKKTAKETQRYIGSVSEEHQARTSAVAEQYSEVNRKLDMHTEMIGGIAEDVAVLKENVVEIKEDLKTKVDKTEVIHLSRRVSVLEHTS